MKLGSRTISFAVTAALHLAAVTALLQFEAVRKPLLDLKPLMVNLITPEVKPPPPEPPKPRPAAPKPQRQLPPRAIEPPPLIASESPAPSPMAPTPAPQPEPAPPAPPAPVADATPPAPPPPAPVVPPTFNAAYLQNPAPAYPPLARRRGEQGTVMLRVFVSAKGLAEQVQVRTSSGHELLDEAAVDAVRRWRFVPAQQGDKPIAAWVLVPIVFTLGS